MCPACSITSNRMQCAVGIMAMLLTSIFGLLGITNGVTLVILSFDHWLPALLFQLLASGLLPCWSDPLPPAQEGIWGLQSLAMVSPNLCAEAHVLSMRQLARLDICQGPCADPPWAIPLPSPGLLCSLFLSSFPQGPLPLVLPAPRQLLPFFTPLST